MQRRCKRCGYTKDWIEFRNPRDSAYPCEECEHKMKSDVYMSVDEWDSDISVERLNTYILRELYWKYI